MAKDNLTKKDINDIKQTIIDDVTKEINKNVSKKVTNNIIKTIKEESTKELKDNFVFEVKNEVKNQIIKEEKKLLRHRTRKIIRRDLIIIFLLAVIVFMGYLMYKDDYIVQIKNKNASTKKVTTKIEKDLTWYKKHYGYLIDNMHLSIPSDNINKYYLYNNDYKTEDINNSIKLSIAYNYLEDSDKIKESDLKKAYKKVFNDSYNDSEFLINCKIYKPHNNYYVAKENECINISDYEIEEEITNIYEDNNNNIIIETVMGVKSDNKLYNYHNLDKKITEHYDSIIEYKNELNSYKYTFNQNKQFISIEKES